ncbi:MAG: DNA polymerase III subunit delta, partial [Shimia sp.]
MKLSPRDATAYFARPDPDAPALLIYGQDAMRVALKRQDMLANLLGPQAEEEMRLTRLDPGAVRKDKAAVTDAAKAVGFFPGPRAVFVDGVSDQHLDAITGALAEWQPGDAQLVLTAGALQKKSKLRKLFEDHPKARVAAIYDDPPSRADIEAELRKAGVPGLSRDGWVSLEALSKALDPGDFRQVVEKLALYKLDDPDEVTLEDVEAIAPQSVEAGVDDLVTVTANGATPQIAPLLARLAAQGTSPVAMMMGLGRHFRMLHVIAADPGGPGAGIGKLRPPLFGPRRTIALAQAQRWGKHKLEAGLAQIMDTDLAL